MSKIKIIRKLKKLMLHERSARLVGNAAEADRFAEIIARLRERHNVTEEIPLDDASDQASAFNRFGGEPVFKPDSKMFRRKRIVWQEAMFHIICTFFDCRAVVFRGSNLKVVVGEKPERERVIRSYLHLHECAESEAAEYLADFKGEPSADNRVRKSSFLHGFAYAVSERLAACLNAREEIEQIAEETGIRPARLEGQALVKIDRVEITEQQKQIAERVEKLPKIKKPQITRLDDDALRSGYIAGAEAPLGDEILLPARQTADDLEEVRRRRDEQHRKIFWEDSFVQNGIWRYGTAGTSSTTGTGFSGWQMTLIFDENDF